MIPIDIKKQTADGDFSLDDLANEYLQNEPTPPSSTEKSSTPTDAITILPTVTLANADGDFSLDDLANEYLQNEPTLSSLNDRPTALSENEEPALAFLSTSAPVTNILSSLVFPPPASEPIAIKAPLESILFCNRLSSSDAADDADCIWKDHSSALGQMFCTKTEEIPVILSKRISSCLLDRSLYERLTRLVNLLPKECVRNSGQQQTIRPNEQNHRSTRGNHDGRRPPPANRLSFQQNSAQIHNRQQAPPNMRPSYSNYGNQQSNPNGHYIDRRQPQQQQYYQNRYPQPNFAPYPMDSQYQPKGPPKNNPYNNNQQQQKKKTQNNNNNTNQATSNSYPPQQRGPKKGGGGGGNGNKPNHDKSGASSTNVKSK